MNTASLARTAVTNSFRSLSRTTLTVIAIVIGAFTLTLTTAVGTGINDYIDDTVASIGASNVMTVTKTQRSGDGPQKYEPGTTLTKNDGTTAGPPGGTVEAIKPVDLTALRAIDGVTEVDPIRSVNPDYVAYDGGRRFQLTATGFTPGTTLQLVAGDQPDRDAKTREIALPESFVDPLGFDDAEGAIGEKVTIGITDATGDSSTITATVVAVVEPTLAGGESAITNDALTTALFDRQNVGLTTAAAQTYAQAVVSFDEASTTTEISDLKDRLADAGYDAQTVEDQIGDFKTVIDAIVLVLNGFAVIALLAAGFGIVNTLLMSVKERTREIGLMKAMGLGGGRIFTMFSMEAVFIGLLGSAIGVGSAMLLGTILNGVLAGGLLSALPGLTLLAFSPASVGTIILVVMGIAFVAGTIPALRAARQDPIDSLRYE